jgi:hypothetical protein
MQIASIKIVATWALGISRVTLLTLLAILPGCALINRHIGETCNTRAYVRTDIPGFIDQRFKGGTTARMAVIPFVTQANFTAQNSELPGISELLAWGVHRELLGYDTLPIIEVFNRQDWPGKKDDFFTGNFGALTLARDAGYDLVLIGYLDRISKLDEWTIHTKIIDVDSGTTLWYGTSRVATNRHDLLEVSSTMGLTDRRPDMLYTSPMVDEAARCIARDIMVDPALEPSFWSFLPWVG